MEPLSHDPILQSKINSACLVFETVFEKYEKPVVLCSFGKRSLLMLWMIRAWFTKEIPVVHLRQPYFPRKYTFSDRIIGEWELDAHVGIPPLGVSLSNKDGKASLLQHFALGQKHFLLPIERQTLESKPRWLCGTETFLRGPFGTFNWPWDVAFQGRGDVPTDIQQNVGSAHLANPLRHFTKEDVEKCASAWGLPVNRLRDCNDAYSDPMENPFHEDYFPFCGKCFDPNEPSSVTCPKSGLEITNIASSLHLIESNQG